VQSSISTGNDWSSQNIAALFADELSMGEAIKPRLLFFRRHGNLPSFIRSQLQEHVKCLSTFFDVRVVSEDGDYREICESVQPDLTLVESGVYGSPPNITNKFAYPEVPKLGFLNADAYCSTRNLFLSDMECWGIETYFTISVSMPEYMPAVTDQLFIWPNFVDPQIYRDYGQPKLIPILTIGSQAMHYPWRNRINRIAAQQFPSLICPHFGWFDAKKAARMIYDEEYAKLINASCVVPTCGTIAREVVRKHFEIPGCNSCLVTERTPALEDAGFVDMRNCVFATEADILDKLDYLFANRDVLEEISIAGRLLVHSQHTFRQRDQILQWYTLNKYRKAHQRIVQTRPFGPLTIVGAGSSERNYESSSNGLDRAILKEGHAQLQLGNYAKADRCYMSCLNYHRMPEPFLGLTLSSLKKGDPRSALRWISQSITYAFETDKAIDPDPVEWAYFIISLLCGGDVEEATRRAHQFPHLRHRELDRCRGVLDALARSTNPGSQAEETKSRPSIHQLPKRDLATWLDELCEMLLVCQQGQLAERLHMMRRADRKENVPRSYYRESTSKINTSRVASEPILPLMPEPFNVRMRRRIPSMMRGLSAKLRARVKRSDAFASAVWTWAREDQVSSALVLGPSHRSVYTRAFLDGIQKNPFVPIVVCMGSLTTDFKKLQKRFAGNPRIKFTSLSLQAAKTEAELDYFDLVLIDKCTLGEAESLEAISGAKTILVRDIDTHSGYAIANTLLLDNEYRVADDSLSDVGHSTIFTKANPYVC
jgi:hypothetical protein